MSSPNKAFGCLSHALTIAIAVFVAFVVSSSLSSMSIVLYGLRCTYIPLHLITEIQIQRVSNAIHHETKETSHNNAMPLKNRKAVRAPFHTDLKGAPEAAWAP